MTQQDTRPDETNLDPGTVAKNKRSARFTLILIALLFAVPVIIAVLMNSKWWSYKPGTMRNNGLLVAPPVTAQILVDSGRDLNGQWQLVYDMPAPCDKTCIDTATAIRQIHRASGRNQGRIGLIVLGNTQASEQESVIRDLYDQFEWSSDGSNRYRASLSEARNNSESTGQDSGGVYLMDPQGNIMMFYPAGSNPNDINKDLKRLLKWSKADSNHE